MAAVAGRVDVVFPNLVLYTRTEPDAGAGAGALDCCYEHVSQTLQFDTAPTRTGHRCEPIHDGQEG